jgi:hypothetical protein
MLGGIALNPDLAITNIKMNQAMMNALGTIPANREHQIAVGRRIKDRFGLEIAIGIGNLRQCGQNLFNDQVIRH